MADLRSVVYSRDASPNAGESTPRPLARAFVFKTNMSLAELTAANAIRASELTNADVGEDITVYGPGYARTFVVAQKVGEFVHLQRTGTEDGPDRVICGQSIIPAGEVGIDIDIELGGLELVSDRLSVTLVDCDVPHRTSHIEGGIAIDIETACLADVEVLWQVFP